MRSNTLQNIMLLFFFFRMCMKCSNIHTEYMYCLAVAWYDFIHYRCVYLWAKDTNVQSQDSVVLIKPQDCTGSPVTCSHGECLCRSTILCFLSQNCCALCLNKYVCVFGTTCTAQGSLKDSHVRHQQEGSWSCGTTDEISPDLYPYLFFRMCATIYYIYILANCYINFNILLGCCCYWCISKDNVKTICHS